MTTNVHEIIIGICDAHRITTRRLAMLAGIPPTTLESAVMRQSDKISIRMLASIAQVFGMPWYALLTMSDDPESLKRDKNPNRISVVVAKAEAEQIIQCFAGLPLPELKKREKSAKWCTGLLQQSGEAEVSGEEHLRQGIMVVLQKLNSEGLLQVMRHALAVASKPEYCRKENVACDCDEQ